MRAVTVTIFGSNPVSKTCEPCSNTSLQCDVCRPNSAIENVYVNEQSCITVDLPPVPRPIICKAPQVKNSKGVCYTPKVTCEPGQVKNSKGKCFTPSKDCPAGQRKNSKGQCYVPEVSCPDGQKKNSKGQCYTPQQAASCDSRSTVQSGNACKCRYSNMRKVNARSCVCKNTGASPISGVGCPTISIGGGGGDDHDGQGKCKLALNGVCLKR